MDEERQDPDQLLRQLVQAEAKKHKGKLKIFFGYAAGVGKTYAMLSSAHELQAEGIDVVAGYIEPHNRPDTMALMAGLEALAPKKLSYRALTLNEFDLDAALLRKPQIILVDELAHTNAQGCRHQKRYQDIQELLRAGIDVYTTVNVQHIESLNDIVSSITQVLVRERIPDYLFDEAEQVDLVDVEPEELLARLKQGQIYQPEQAGQALEHFFTEKNLIALREIALRRMADRVNQKQASQNGTERLTLEHILICLSPSPSNPRVIRQASRMARAFHARFTALFVETPDFSALSAEDLARLQHNTRLAERLGAKTVTSYGGDIVEQIAEYSRLARVSKIVLGRTYTKRGLFSWHESFSEKLISLDPTLEVFLIPDTYAKKFVRPHKQRQLVNWASVGKDSLKVLGLLTAATLLAYLFKYWGLGDSNLIMVYILSVLIISLITSQIAASLLAGVISVLIFNFCFTEPIGTFMVTDPDYIMTLFVMFITAAVGGSLTQKVKQYASQAAQKTYRTEILLETSQKLQNCSDFEEIALSTAGQLNKLLERTIVFYEGSPLAGHKPYIVYAPGEEATTDQEYLEVAQWAYVNSKHAGFSTGTLPGIPNLYLAIRNGEQVFGVVGIVMQNRELDSFVKSIMSAILNECALALERNAMNAQRKTTELQLQKEQLRADLLRAISHDLRTPLTGISGNAALLLNESKSMDASQTQQLYQEIYDDADWLINLVENLLSVTRIENGTMKLQLQPELIEDVVQEAVKHIHLKAGQQLVIANSEELLLAQMDAKLILQVVINLLDNAVNYAGTPCVITLSTRQVEEQVVVEVADTGAGVPDEQKEFLFDMFYTGRQSIADGRRSLGMGLALCRSIINAHGGTLSVRDNAPQGTVFQFTLQKYEVTLR
ncbi:MAG: sensor histidine kinase KdpD [Acidaminococcaceae bacterium]